MTTSTAQKFIGNKRMTASYHAVIAIRTARTILAPMVTSAVLLPHVMHLEYFMVPPTIYLFAC